MEEKYIKIITENTESCKSAHKRLDKMETEIKAINELTIAVKEIAISTKATQEDVNDMNSRLKLVEEKPGRNWDNLIKTIITRNCNSSSGLFFSKIRNVGGKNNMKKKNILIVIIAIMLGIFSGFKFYEENQDKEITEVVNTAIEEVKELEENNDTKDISVEETEIENEIVEENQSTIEIPEQTEDDEKSLEIQEVENESFELQGDIVYEGDRAKTWNLNVGNTPQLTYISQIDSRWRYYPYTSTRKYFSNNRF